MSHSNSRNKIIMASAMLVFGTMGLFISNITFPSSFISLVRAFIGSALIAMFMLISGHGIDIAAIAANLKFLIPSGIIMAFNWICLFEAYKYTGVAVATLCYYMAPVIVMLVSPFMLKERLNAVKIISILTAVVGAVLISGAVTGTVKSTKGILLGLCAAALYSSIVILNKFVRNISPLETTLVQLFVAGVAMIPYVLFTEKVTEFKFDRVSVISLLIVGVVHTGIAYVAYFASMQKIMAQTTAIFSYIDPVTAIILSAVVLHESMDVVQIIGTVLILSATLFNELIPILNKRKCTE